MQFKKLAQVDLPALGLGTWTMGGREFPDKTHDTKCMRAIREAIFLGMTHIDTAEAYAAGHTEEIVGEAIGNMSRDRLFITTKVAPEHLHYDDVIASAKASLMRLKTDYIDLYLVHNHNPNIPLEETMRAMDELITGGLVRFIGVSNFNLKQLMEAQICTKYGIVANQVEYNLLTRDQGQFSEGMESQVLPYCQKNRIMLIAHRPTAKGMLTRPGYALLDELSGKYQRPHAQIALNWLISKQNVITIPRSTDVAHIQELAHSIDFSLDEEDIKRLDNGLQ